jgi:hypothetical protein
LLFIIRQNLLLKWVVETLAKAVGHLLCFS